MKFGLLMMIEIEDIIAHTYTHMFILRFTEKWDYNVHIRRERQRDSERETERERRNRQRQRETER